MDFRVFAYGGTSFRDRLRMGDWPGLPTAVFEDYYGLRGGLPWFGFCVLDNRPFLLWRELQNVANRGGYPFTLLLDPGIDIYEAAGWNTAGFLSVLFEGANAIGRRLLEQPEAVGAGELQALFEQALGKITPVSEAPDSALEIWAACALAADVLAVSPSSLSLKGRPEASVVARIQNQLPVGLRNSGGWMVGGSAAHARQLGARLAVDDRTEQPVEALAAVLRSGRELLQSMKKINSLPEWQQTLLDGRREVPAWRSAEAIQLTLRAVQVLEEATRKPERLLDFVTELTEGTARDQWSRQACELLLRKGGGLTVRETQFLLTEAHRGVFTLRVEHYSRLDAPALKAFLAEKEIPPQPSPASLGLPDSVLVSRWKSLIAKAGDSAPSLVREAFEALPDRIANHAEQDLIETAWSASAAKGGNLESWRDLVGRPDVKKRLAAEARRRALETSVFSLDEYEEFAADPEWKYLEKGLRPEAISRIANILIARRDVERLNTIAHWVQRTQLSVADRRTIAELAGGGWSNFDLLDRLIGGGVADEIPSLPESERAILRREAIDLAGELHRNTPHAPNLSGMRELLGSLPDQLIRVLSLTEPALEDESPARRWIDGWRGLDHRKHDKELARFVRLNLLGASPRVVASSTEFLERENLAEFLKQLLWKETVLADANLSYVLECLFHHWRDEPGFREVVNEVFSGAAENPKKKILKRVNARPGTAALFEELLADDRRRNLREMELEGLLLGEEPAALPHPEQLREFLIRTGRERLNRTLRAWLSGADGEEARRVAYRFAASKAHLAALLENLDEPQQSRLIETILDSNVPIDPQFPVDKVEHAVKTANELGIVGRALTRVRLTTRPNWSPPPSASRSILGRLLK